jgi:hypothetical protein
MQCTDQELREIVLAEEHEREKKHPDLSELP